MEDLAKNFLNATEQQRVSEAVQQAERQTSGEIVPMVAGASHHYPMAAVTGAVFCALPMALAATALLGSYLWLGPQNMWLFVLFFGLFYLPMRFIIARSARLKRLFLTENQVTEEVEEAAITAFYHNKLHRTANENGVLIYVSVLERRVWILGDAGIDAKIPPQTWQEIIAELSAGIRQGKQAEALCSAINKVGLILKDHFPIGKDDRNELHNLIIRP